MVTQTASCSGTRTPGPADFLPLPSKFLHRGALELRTLGRVVCSPCVCRPAKAFVCVAGKVKAGGAALKNVSCLCAVELLLFKRAIPVSLYALIPFYDAFRFGRS